MKPPENQSYHVLRMTGKAGEVLRLFALWVEKRGNVSIAEVK